jgi:RND family efflux transporter MFP subunit
MVDDRSDDVEPPRRPKLWPVRWVAAVMLAVALLGIGGLAGVLWSERRAARIHATSPTPSGKSSAAEGPTMPAASASGTRAAPPAEEPVEVTLSAEALSRVGLKLAEARVATARSILTVPGTVFSNAYRDTKVNTLVGGVVRRVDVELGSAVRRGAPMAVVFSAELADAQMKYVSMQAMLGADHQKLERTRKLVALGAASRQELEEIAALHAAHATEVAAYRQRLLLLGLGADQVARFTDATHVVSEVVVPAPADGVVVTRTVNPGQVVNAGQDLFVVTDLSTVWIIGDVYENDFAAVTIGAPATVTVPATSGQALRGRVAYIDPRVDAATRTAKVRVEVPNNGGALRLGMYVQVSFQTARGPLQTVIPRAAVQALGARSVVYVATGDEGRFEERRVKLGPVIGEDVEVLEGVKAGERVVAEGSFFLRAEAARTRR